jgi:hypothetical protein
MLSPPIGVKVTPAPKLRDFSGSSGCAPSALATGENTGNVPISIKAPPTLFVDVVANDCWAKLGALKPVETEPRKATPSIISKAEANYYSTIDNLDMVARLK